MYGSINLHTVHTTGSKAVDFCVKAVGMGCPAARTSVLENHVSMEL